MLHHGNGTQLNTLQMYVIICGEIETGESYAYHAICMCERDDAM